MFDVLPPQVEKALGLLEERGAESYIVGGCVRDQLLGKPPCDWDITTRALPPEITACFAPHARVIPIGERHGTMTVLLDGMRIEVTTFRIDGDYSDCRRPDSVRFTDRVREDLARRDFTVNAMAYSPRTGLIDPFGGQEDVRAGIICCVGDPDQRFHEDALRIMRALRFAAQHGFTIQEETARSLVRCREELRLISVERLREELFRLLLGDHVGAVLREYAGVLQVFLPELGPMQGFCQRNPNHLYDVYEHTVRVVENAPPVIEARFAALLHDSGKPDCFSVDEDGVGHFYSHPMHSARHAREILSRLKAGNHTRDTVVMLVENHDAHIPGEMRSVRRWLCRLGERDMGLLLGLKRADCIGQGTHPERIGKIAELEELVRQALEEGSCLSLHDLALNGRDLLEMGLPAGPMLGRILQALLEEVLDGRCRNERDAQLREVRRLLKDPRRFL